MNYEGMLIKLFIFIVLLTIGYICAQKGILSDLFSKDASWLLLNLYIASSIINSVLGERPDITSRELAVSLLAMTVTIVTVYAIGTVSAKLFGKDNFPQNLILLSVVNNLFVGMPIVQALCGSEAGFYIGVSGVPYNIILFTYGVWILKRGKGEKGIKLKDIVSVSLIASLTALVIFVSGVKVPRLVTDFFSTVSGATVPLSMIVVGATLGNIKLTDAFKDKTALLMSIVRLIIAPVAVFFIMKLITDNKVLALTCMVVAACPPGVVCTPLSIRYGYSAEKSSRTIMVMTVLSMITIPILVYIMY